MPYKYCSCGPCPSAVRSRLKPRKANCHTTVKGKGVTSKTKTKAKGKEQTRFTSSIYVPLKKTETVQKSHRVIKTPVYKLQAEKNITVSPQQAEALQSKERTQVERYPKYSSGNKMSERVSSIAPTPPPPSVPSKNVPAAPPPLSVPQLPPLRLPPPRSPPPLPSPPPPPPATGGPPAPPPRPPPPSVSKPAAPNRMGSSSNQQVPKRKVASRADMMSELEKKTKSRRETLDRLDKEHTLEVQVSTVPVKKATSGTVKSVHAAPPPSVKSSNAVPRPPPPPPPQPPGKASSSTQQAPKRRAASCADMMSDLENKIKRRREKMGYEPDEDNVSISQKSTSGAVKSVPSAPPPPVKSSKTVPRPPPPLPGKAGSSKNKTPTRKVASRADMMSELENKIKVRRETLEQLDKDSASTKEKSTSGAVKSVLAAPPPPVKSTVPRPPTPPSIKAHSSQKQAPTRNAASRADMMSELEKKIKVRKDSLEKLDKNSASVKKAVPKVPPLASSNTAPSSPPPPPPPKNVAAPRGNAGSSKQQVPKRKVASHADIMSELERKTKSRRETLDQLG